MRVTKVEKIVWIKTRLNPLSFFNGKSAANLRTGERSTTIPSAEKSAIGVRLKRVGEIPLNGNGAIRIQTDKDIVCSHAKV